jgi:DNA-binding NtrC family response regulator
MKKLKVLIVDDEMDYCLIMKSYFEARGYEVFIGSSRADCLKLLKEKHPDILLLDNNLPDGRGWELVDSIKKEQPEIRIYLISAYHQTEPFTTSTDVTIWEKPISLHLLNKAFA